ncbi:hypothetical protein BS78_02G397600 [Paspalum vaginatum]|nr:hypothetical protein BS78_02G397600 [Paspalum vaginatum]
MRGQTHRRGISQGSDDHGLCASAVADLHLAAVYLFRILIFDSEIGSSSKQEAPGILSESLLCSSKRVGITPMKMLMDDGVSWHVRNASLGIVGRLMGLDTMPSFGVHSQSTYTGIHSHIMSPRSSCEKYGFSGDIPHRRSTYEIPEFKDVFEVVEAARMKTQSLSSGCTNICSGLDKVSSADINFMRQKFMDAKHLSTEESFQKSEEFDDALEALVSNKGLLLEFLRKSNHVPNKECADLTCSPFSAVNRITVLKPSRRNKFVDSNIIYPQEDTTRCFHALIEMKHSPRKHCANQSRSSQLPKENIGSFRQNFSKSSFQKRIDTHALPTRIVVLKPCLKKTENMEGAFLPTHEMFQSTHRKPKAPLDYGSATRNPHTEEYMYQMTTGKCDVLTHGDKGSIQIAREVTKQMRSAAKGSIGGNLISNPNIGPLSCDVQVSLLASNTKLKGSQASQRSNGCHDSLDASNSGYSPTHSTKTSVRNEAKRRLSDRWEMTHHYQDPSQDDNSFITLGDMLALSDNEVLKFISRSSTCREFPKGHYPLGVNSNNCWKDESLCNSTRLKHLSSSSIRQNSLKVSRRKENSRLSELSVLKDIVIVTPNNSEDELVHRRPRSLVRSSAHHYDESDMPSLDGDESMVTEREIHVNFEEPTCSIDYQIHLKRNLYSLQILTVFQPANSNCILIAHCSLDSSYLVPECQDEIQAFVAGNSVMHQEQTWVPHNNLGPPGPGHSANQAEEHVLDQSRGNAFESNSPEESVSHMGSHEDDQPNPVPLRMQLRLLKMEATDNADETELALSSDDGISASFKPDKEAGQISDTFWYVDERDFSYVLDMLTCLGSDVYDSLEKKYMKLISWPQPERRLLFDLTNDALRGVVTSLTQGVPKKWQSKWDKEGVLDEAWGRVCRQRREAECFQEERLMGVIAGELGSMLGEDILGGVMPICLVP